MQSSDKNPEYGNWVPSKLLFLLWVLTAVMAVLLAANLIWWHKAVLTVLFLIGFAVLLVYAILMQQLHHCFSFTGGKLMEKIHEYLLAKLTWDGNGTILDIGCGSGALIIRAAKKFPKAKAVGMDYWGATWDYAQKQCQENARLEGVSSVKFVKGDAAHMDFPDNSMDAAISNFVFHEVRSVSDKRALVREALRVVKPGGSFAFHDLFDSRRLYGSMDEFIQELRDAGISEIHYEPKTENLPFVPGYIKITFRQLGLLYGKK